MRYGYFAYEHRKTNVEELVLELIGFAVVNPVKRMHETYAAKLRTWALDLLVNGRHETGVFSFCYGEVTDFDEPGEAFAEFMLAWDGTRELIPVL